MNDKQVETAKALVSCKRWSWHQQTLNGMAIVMVEASGKPSTLPRISGVYDVCGYPGYPVVPDLSDPATVGCLWRLLVEACATHKDWREPCLYDSGGVVLENCWSVHLSEDDVRTHTPGEGPWMEERFESVALALLRVWGTGYE